MNSAPDRGLSKADEAWLKLLGARVRNTRRHLDLTQETVSERARIRHQTLIHLEKGRHAPSVLTLRRVAEAMGVPVQDLLP